MTYCMSSSPFDSDSILKWFSSEESNNVQSSLSSSSNFTTVDLPGGTSSSRPTPGSNEPHGSLPEPVLSSIPVLVGSEIVQLSVPIDLLCALMLTHDKQGAASYTLQDVVVASDNLKRFRDVAASSASTATSSTAIHSPAPAPVTPTEPPAPSVDLVSMSLDPSGSVVVQEMIMKASDYEKRLIFSQLSSAILLVATNSHGCRVVQRALEYGNHALNFDLFKSIPPFKLVDLCVDVNGNHVMQKFAESLPQSALHDLVAAITDPSTHNASTVSRLSLHSYGCRVIQRLLVRCAEGDRSLLLSYVIAAFPELVSDQFGNYVAQHSLEHSTDLERRAIIATLAEMDTVGLCCNKFASNVVEKAIRTRLAEKTVLHRLIATIIQTEATLLALMQDKYGNYVIKAICDLSQAEFPEVAYVRNVLIANSGTLKKYTYGFHLIEKLERGNAGGRGRAGSGYSETSASERRARAGFQHL